MVKRSRLKRNAGRKKNYLWVFRRTDERGQTDISYSVPFKTQKQAESYFNRLVPKEDKRRAMLVKRIR